MQVIQMASIPPASCKKVKILDFFMPYLYIVTRGLFRKVSAGPLFTVSILLFFRFIYLYDRVVYHFATKFTILFGT